MRILLVGGGGREHALAWTLAGSPLCDKLFCAPGNAGIAGDAECVPIGSDESERLVAFAREQKLDLVVVGPEAPLVAGLVDRLEAAGIRAFGPSAEAARLEASKGFTKDLCRRFGIPTAGYRRFTELEPAKRYIRELAAAAGGRLVVKADGLAAGKGVTIAESAEAAEAAAEAALAGRAFGAAGAEIVIEEFLEGEEVSFFALVDGRHALPLASAQDHKRAFDGDQGPNTGGMGAYSPARLMTPELQARIMTEIIEPTVAGMAELGAPFKGVLYAGLMVSDGAPKLIEYNVRFGDPECQVLMMRLMSDLIPALLASIDGELKDFDLRWYPEAALTVVMAARGYPGRYKSGEAIEGLDAALEVEDVEIFHAGTKAGPNGEVLSNGGRVLSVTALGETLAEAQRRAYRAVDLIDWPGGFCRRDIGWRALEDGKR